MPELDRLIDIQQATVAQDAAGQEIQTWTALESNVPAEYLPLSGREYFEARQTQAEAVARFRIRHRTDLTRKGMRIVYNSEYYDIEHFEEDRRYDRRQYMIVMGVAKVS